MTACLSLEIVTGVRKPCKVCENLLVLLEHLPSCVAHYPPTQCSKKAQFKTYKTYDCRVSKQIDFLARTLLLRFRRINWNIGVNQFKD